MIGPYAPLFLIVPRTVDENNEMVSLGVDLDHGTKGEGGGGHNLK